MSESCKTNDNITPSEARTLLETMTWLCHNCVLTHYEAGQIVKICQDCLARLERNDSTI